MRETAFVKQNKEKWAKFESLSKQKNNDPDEISELFTEITEDLSYARTFYPRRSVRVYLNHLAQGVFMSLYKQKKQPISGFITFWTESVPLAVYRARKNLLMAFIFFCAAIILGAVSQHYDETFANIILGDNYVHATEARIEQGDPMGIYGESSEVSMAFGITINNITVAFYAFVLGVFFSFGSYIILLTNGIMLGAFQWWFYGKGLLLTSFLAIWIHGAFEISAIVIAGAAGITLGNGLLFPKSYSRLQSLIFSAKQGFIILMSLVPVFIIAGILESFVTRYYQSMPILLNWFIIIGSFAIIILYYVIIPFKVAKKHPEKTILKEAPRYIPKREIINSKIRTSGEIFSDSIYTFIFRIKTFASLSTKLLIPIALVLLGAIIYYHNYELSFNNDWSYNFEIVFGTHDQFRAYKYVGWALALTLVIGITIYTLNQPHNTSIKVFAKSYLVPLFWIFIFMLICMIGFVFSNWFLFILLIAFLGFFIQFVPIIIIEEKVNLFTAITRALSIIKLGYGQAISSAFATITISIIFFFILHNPFELGILMLIDEFLADILVGNMANAYFYINLFNILVYIVFIAFVVQLFYINGYYFYHSQIEKDAANDLLKDINTIGKRSKVFETATDFE
ncbi:MAG: stage II sporulation protein M [Putridiphycobacter sp.]|nr:stage II sporulation protein M [Putridiphycobacter sp.]